MNPYTYSRWNREQQQASRPDATSGSFVRELFKANVSSFIAVAFLIFIAGSVVALALSLNADYNTEPAVSFVHKAQAQVLGDSTVAARTGQVIYKTDKTVYLVGSSGLYGFPSASVFYSWGYTFAQVLPANSAEQAMSMVGIVPVKQSGCSSALDQISGTCGSSTITLPDQTSPRVGQLVYNPGSHTIYYVGSNGLYGIPSVAVFSSWGWVFDQILPANTAEQALTQVGIIPSRNPYCSNPIDQINGSCGTSSTSTSTPVIITQISPASGAVGTSVTITGSGFTTGSNYVVSNGTALAGNLASNGASITFTIPASAGAFCPNPFSGQSGAVACPQYALLVTPRDYVLTVVNSNGTSNAVNFTVIGPTAATSGIRVGAVVNNNGTIYLVGQAGLYGFPDLATFNSWGFTVSSVVTANTAEQALSVIGTVPSRNPYCNSPLDQIKGTCGNSTANVTVSPQSLFFTSPSGTTPVAQAVTVSGVTFGSNSATNPALMIQVSSDSLSWLGVSTSNAGFGSSMLSFPGNGTFYVSVKPTNGTPPGTTLSGKILINNMTGAYPTVAITIPVVFTYGSSMSNTAPSFTLPNLTANGATLQPNVSFGFNFNVTDAQGGTLTAKVGWGDYTTDTNTVTAAAGVTATFPRFSHTYSQAGSYQITVTVTDSQGLSSTQTASVMVVSPSAFSVSPLSLIFEATSTSASGAVTAQQPVLINTPSAAAGWTAQVSGGNIPGMNLYANGTVGGIVSGTGPTGFAVAIFGPLTPGNYGGGITVTSGGQTKTVQVYLTVTSAQSSLQVTTGSLGTAVAGQAFSTQLQATGGTAPYSWSIVSTTYPAGCCILGLNGSSGLFNTQSSAAVSTNYIGTYSWTVQVKDAAGAIATKTLGLTITAATSSAPPSAPQMSLGPSNGTVLVNTSQQFNFMAAAGSQLTFMVNWGDGSAVTTMPGQASTNGSYMIGPLHTWTTAGTYTITVSVTNGSGASSSATFPVTVTAANAATAAVPTLSAILDGSTPTAWYIASGQTGVTFTVVNLSSTGGDSSLSQVSIEQSGTAPLVKNIKVYDASNNTLLGSIASLPNLEASTAQYWGSINFASPLVIPKGTMKTIKIVADAPAGTGTISLGLVGAGSNNANQRYSIPGVYGNPQTVR